MFLFRRASAKDPSWTERRRFGVTKMESVVGRYWCQGMEVAAVRRVFAGMERSWASFEAREWVAGMLSAEQSALNCFCASRGLLGCTPGPLDQMHARLIMAVLAGWRRS